MSIPCLDQLLTYKMSGSVLVVWVEWCGSGLKHLLMIAVTEIGTTLCKLLYGINGTIEAELIIEDK